MCNDTLVTEPPPAEDGPVIRARVDGRLLGKADRLFTGTVEGRMIELLQNARRAGANQVTITVADGWVSVQDDGEGIADFRQLLSMGGSGWDEATQAGEHPAGVGLFSLAPRETIIASRGRMIHLQAKHWTGRPVPIEPADEPVSGTMIRFRAEDGECRRWASTGDLLPYVAFTGLTVVTDSGTITPTPFLTGQTA